jgi:hypothetical protein
MSQLALPASTDRAHSAAVGMRRERRHEPV